MTGPRGGNGHRSLSRTPSPRITTGQGRRRVLVDFGPGEALENRIHVL